MSLAARPLPAESTLTHMAGLRVALLGNLCNTVYNFAKLLRRVGVEAEVYLSTRELASEVGAPQWEDPELAGRSVPWLHTYRDRDPLSLARLLLRLRSYDVVHACATPISFCQFSGVPVVAHALGADMKEVAHTPGLRGRLMLRGFRHARQVLFSDLDHVPHSRALRLHGARYLSAAVDTEKYSPAPSDLQYGVEDGKTLKLLHSSFLAWTGSGTTEKCNDRFFRAFARYSRQQPEVFLVAIEAGPDAALARGLVEQLGIADRVRFVPPMDKALLLEHYRWCDVIVDQFGMPKLGVNALEGMSCGRPVLVSLDGDTAAACYDDLPPVYACSTEDEILAQLQAIDGPQGAHQRGVASREWILRHHHWERVLADLLEVYDTVATG